MGYVAPASNAVDFSHAAGYSAPAYTAVNLASIVPPTYQSVVEALAGALAHSSVLNAHPAAASGAALALVRNTQVFGRSTVTEAVAAAELSSGGLLVLALITNSMTAATVDANQLRVPRTAVNGFSVAEVNAITYLAKEVVSNGVGVNAIADFGGLVASVLEALSFVHSHATRVEAIDSLAAGFTASSVLSVVYHLVREIDEALGVGDSLLRRQFNEILESAAVGNTLTNKLKAKETALAELGVSGLVRLLFKSFVESGVGFTTNTVEDVRILRAIAEALTIVEVADDFLHAAQIVAEAAALTSIGRWFIGGLATSTAGVGAQLDQTVRALKVAITTLGMTATATPHLRLMALISESLGDSDSLDFRQILSQVLTDGFAFVGSLVIAGQAYYVRVMNTETFGLWEYNNFNFNSFALVGNKYMAASSTGIFELTGSTDAGTNIAASVKTGLMDFGTSLKKRMPEAYIGYTSTGTLVMKVTTTTGGTKEENWYQLTETQGAHDTERLKVGKGLSARYWQFEVINSGGADFDIASIELHPVVLTRRV